MKKFKFVIGEIEYTNEKGEGVHSDLGGNFHNPDFKDFLRSCFEEWIEKSNGTGTFWIGKYPEDHPSPIEDEEADE